MTHRRLPPLAAIRAFDAAARHLGFTAAAAELNVTQSAISHQIRGLEEFVGVALFNRTGNRVSLTAAGQRYSAEVAEVLDGLDKATRRVARPRAKDTLAIRGTPAFVARWLVPRFEHFRAHCPGVDWTLTTGLPPTDFQGGALDIVFHWGDQPVPGVRVEPFLASRRFAVASPDLVRQQGIGTPDDLRRVPLLRDVTGDQWPDYLDLLGVSGFEPSAGPRFEHCELTLTAAERGQGVALAYGALVRRELAEGRLVRLFDTETEPIVIYSLATEESRAGTPVIEAFREWLLGEAAAQADTYPFAGAQAAE